MLQKLQKKQCKDILITLNKSFVPTGSEKEAQLHSEEKYFGKIEEIEENIDILFPETNDESPLDDIKLKT